MRKSGKTSNMADSQHTGYCRVEFRSVHIH